MIFQVLDNKIECVGYYSDGKIYKEDVGHGFTQTWDSSPNFMSSAVDYAKIYAGVDSIDDVPLPDHLHHRWQHSTKRMKSFIKSLGKAKVSLDDHCFYDLVPDKFLTDFYEDKTEITKFVFENFSKPANYSFLKEVNLLLTKISGQKLIIDRSKLNQRFMKKTDFVAVQKFLNSSDKISYNIFKSKTGRLSTQKNSFPILAFDKRFRQILKPHNHWFLELDFNANELRVLQALNGVEQPKEDIHEWNIKNVFRGLGTRAEAKKRAFAWLYNPNSEDHLMSRFYNKDKILSTYYKDGIITTPFDRKIPSDDFHALNYLIQSTASDVCLTQAIKLDKLLNNRKSYITAVIHDSVLIDYNEEDRDLLKDLVETYGNTSLGEFKVNIAAGVNYGEMKELCR
jgi:hypothetical protein